MSDRLPVAAPDGVVPALWDQLNPREQAFVLHPKAMTDPISAAIESGYSETWARGHAHAKRKQLMFYIRPQHVKRMEASGITIQRVQEELACIAFADETEFYERVDMDVFGGEVLVGKDPTLMPEHMRRAIERIETETITLSDGKNIQRVSFVLHDKTPALKMLAEMLGGFDPRSREPGDAADRRRQAELFEFMKPDEIETIVKIYKRAEKRQLAAAEDATIIEGEKK